MSVSLHSLGGCWICFEVLPAVTEPALSPPSETWYNRLLLQGLSFSQLFPFVLPDPRAKAALCNCYHVDTLVSPICLFTSLSPSKQFLILNAICLFLLTGPWLGDESYYLAKLHCKIRPENPAFRTRSYSHPSSWYPDLWDQALLLWL